MSAAHFHEILLGQLALIAVAEAVADDLSGNLNREIDDGIRELSHGLAALRAYGVASFGDRSRGLFLSLGENAGTLGLGLSLGLGDDLIRLVLGVSDLSLILLVLLDSTGLLGRGGIKVALDLLLTLIHHAQDGRPDELGRDDPDNEKSDKGRNELRHLGKQNLRTARRLRESGRRDKNGESGDYADKPAPLRVAVHTLAST